MMRPGAPITASAIALTAYFAGCAEIPRREIRLDTRTDHIEGWLDTRGEISVFPDKPSRGYDPYGWNDSQHCVTVVTESPEVRSAVRMLVGERVRVWGRPVLYEELSHGTSPHDVLLSKRYYKTTLVENSCLRDYIFVADRLEEI